MLPHRGQKTSNTVLKQPLSILIRTFNSAHTLGRVLGELDLIDSDQCIIVDSGSTDRTFEIADRFGAEVVHARGDFHYSKSLNLGFEVAHWPWVLVLSSHCIPARENLLEQFRRVIAGNCENLAVVYGKSSLYMLPDDGFSVHYGDSEKWQAGQFHPGANTIAMYSKEVWARKRFRRDIPTAEDHDWFVWAMKEGYRACALPNAVVLYRNKGSLNHMFKKGMLECRTLELVYGSSRGRNSFKVCFKWFLKMCRKSTKLLLCQKIDFGTYVRMCAHHLGSLVSYFRR